MSILLTFKYLENSTLLSLKSDITLKEIKEVLKKSKMLDLPFYYKLYLFLDENLTNIVNDDIIQKGLINNSIIYINLELYKQINFYTIKDNLITLLYDYTMEPGSEKFINFNIDEFRTNYEEHIKQNLYHIGDIKDKLFLNKVLKIRGPNKTKYYDYEYDESELKKLNPLPDNTYFKNFSILEFLIN